MSKAPKETKADAAKLNVTLQNDDATLTENSETVREAITRLTLNDPQFIQAKPSGKAFVIVGTKPK